MKEWIKLRFRSYSNEVAFLKQYIADLMNAAKRDMEYLLTAPVNRIIDGTDDRLKEMEAFWHIKSREFECAEQEHKEFDEWSHFKKIFSNLPKKPR